jgi:predicted metal-dependent hydrolase
MNTLFIRYMKKAKASVRPKEITAYSYNPYLVMSDERCLSYI